eukprot:1375487-Pyramimonas_sp.AAC.1
MAKSRWWAHGHQDQDAESWSLTVAHVRNAFCRSNRLRRPAGSIHVGPLSGLDVLADQLIELIVPVH